MHKVCGLGNPLVDILIHVDEDFIKKYNLNKGVMHLITQKEKAALLDAIYNFDYQTEVGGSAPNTITTLSKLGIKTALAGKVGDDELGNLFVEKLVQKGVRSFLKKSSTDTGISIVLITPDGERTMNTYLGASREFKPEELDEEMIKNSEYFYFTGYMWDTENQKAATIKAIEIAKRNGVKVIFDLADPFAVDRYRDDFIALLKNDIDIALANSEEARLLTGISEPSKAVRELGKTCNTFIVKNGEKETYIAHNGDIHSVKSFKTRVIDTTGAGDNFAAGFIFGIINQLSVEESCRIASFVALKTIEKVGAQAPDNIFEMVKNRFNSIKNK